MRGLGKAYICILICCRYRETLLTFDGGIRYGYAVLFEEELRTLDELFRTDPENDPVDGLELETCVVDVDDLRKSVSRGMCLA